MQANILMNFCRQDCIQCGTVFFIPQTLDATVRDTGQTFYCPNGHPQAYSESNADKFRTLYNKGLEANKANQNSLSNAREEIEHLKIDLAAALNKPKRKTKNK